jgi:hypothetical protein
MPTVIVIPWPFPGRTPLCLYHLMLDHPGLRRIWTVPKGFCHPPGWTLSGATSPFRALPGNVPNAYSKPRLFNTWRFTAQIFPRMFASLVPGPQRLLLQGLCPTIHLSPALTTGPGHPCASTTLVATLVQERPKGIAVTHWCSTVALYHTSATMTYVIWRAEHLCSINAVQTIRLSNLVLSCELYRENIFNASSPRSRYQQDLENLYDLRTRSLDSGLKLQRSYRGQNWSPSISYYSLFWCMGRHHWRFTDYNINRKHA